MSNIALTVNGRMHAVDVDPATPLLYILRNDIGLQGPRFGCGLGQCGACTVIINGAAIRSCITPASTVKGEITTARRSSPKEVSCTRCSRPGLTSRSPQCGFCQNGQIMAAKVLLDKNPKPTDAQIREGMNHTLCRCMTVLPHPGRHQARGQGHRGGRTGVGKGGGRMTACTHHPETYRR